MSRQKNKSSKKTSSMNHETSPSEICEDLAFKVPLHRLQLDTWNSRVRLSNGGTTAERVTKDFKEAFVQLSSNLTTDQFIVVQVLETDPTKVGGLHLYMSSWNEWPFHSVFEYSDSKCSPKDYLIIWLSEYGILTVMKNNEKQSNIMRQQRLKGPKRYWLLSQFILCCDMYGSVVKLRAFIGDRRQSELFVRVPDSNHYSTSEASSNYPTDELGGNNARCLPSTSSSPGDNAKAFLIFKLYENGLHKNEVVPIEVKFPENLLSASLECAVSQTNNTPSVTEKCLEVRHYWSHKERTGEYEVQLSPLLFNAERVNSNIKFNKDPSIATRIGEGYTGAFVILASPLTPNDFILIQILKVDRQKVGGLKLCLKRDGKPDSLFSDSKTELYDSIVVGMVEKNVLVYYKDGSTRIDFWGQPIEAENFELVCEMYGPVQQIRAYVGHLDREKNSIETPDEVGEDIAALYTKKSKEKTGDTPNETSAGPSEEAPSLGDASSKNSADETSAGSSEVAPSPDASSSSPASPEKPKPTLTISYVEGIVKKITVEYLPTTSNSTSDPDTNGTSDEAFKECQICMDKNADTVIDPCGHLVCCYECASRIFTRCGSHCPICRTEIKTSHKIYSRIAKCKECEDPVNVVLIPCGDMCLCGSCSTGVEKCPECLMSVKGHQKVI